MSFPRVPAPVTWILATWILAAWILATPVAAQPPLPVDTLPKGQVNADGKVNRPLGLGWASKFQEPVTQASFELGRRLFFDPILSADRSVSCASCHRPDHGLSSPEKRPVGVHGRKTRYHAPSLYNREFDVPQGWEGGASGLAPRVAQSIEHPDEMGLPLGEAVARLQAHTEYRREFDQLFRLGPSERNIERVLTSFLLGMMIGDSVVDHYRLGNENAMTEQEKKGLWIFEGKGRCWRCHKTEHYTDETFHNTGVGVVDGVPEEGRYRVTRRPFDMGKFKTPTLRGLAATAPYMHDGSLATLHDVVDFYAAGGNPNSHLDWRIEPIALNDDEREALVAFLKALSRPFQ